MDRKRPLLRLTRVAVEGLLALPTQAQRQALKKMAREIEVEPSKVGYPLKRKLAGFRGVHSGRYRIIWRVLTTEDGREKPEVVYVGIRAEGDERDAYAELQRLMGGILDED